jgi:hypothetical protein
MLDRTAANHPHHAAAFGRTAAVALPVILFAAVLLFAFLVSLRYAHGWAEVVSEGTAAAVSMASDGLAAVVSTVVAAAGVVWLYVRQLAR